MIVDIIKPITLPVFRNCDLSRDCVSQLWGTVACCNIKTADVFRGECTKCVLVEGKRKVEKREAWGIAPWARGFFEGILCEATRKRGFILSFSDVVNSSSYWTLTTLTENYYDFSEFFYPLVKIPLISDIGKTSSSLSLHALKNLRRSARHRSDKENILA